MWQRLLIIFTIGFFATALVFFLNPVNSKIHNLVYLASICAAWLGVLTIFWKQKYVKTILIVLPLILALPLFLPGRTINKNELRKDYVKRMRAFEGVRYYWGGENFFGIDCSGLPRRALRDALLAYGIKHANGKAFRMYLEQWWFDASALALNQGFRNYTKRLETRGAIKTMDYSDLLPGDLAVTTGGSHMLVYLGEGKWIQADPGTASVIVLNGHTDPNSWFNHRVTTHCWSVINTTAMGNAELVKKASDSSIE